MFQTSYPSFSVPIENNIYAIASHKSLIDFETFVLIMKGHGCKMREVDPGKFNLTNVDGALTCDERAIDHGVARQYFMKSLKSILRLNSPATSLIERKNKILINGESFDQVINCSQNHFMSSANVENKYEVCAMGSYLSKKFGSKAITIMDGPFSSLFPNIDVGSFGRYWLSGVEETRISSHSTHAEAAKVLEQVRATDHSAIVKGFEDKIGIYYPDFKSQFSFEKMHFVVKVKPLSDANASRDATFLTEGRMSYATICKITHIFDIEQEVRDLLGLAARRDAAA